MDSLSKGVGRGGEPESADSSCWPANTPPSGVGFSQCTTPHIWEALHPVEEALDEYYLPELFKGATVEVLFQGITCITVKQTVLEIQKPNLSALENWTTYCVVTRHLVAAFRR